MTPRFWQEFRAVCRGPGEGSSGFRGNHRVAGAHPDAPSIEKSIAPLRSFVAYRCARQVVPCRRRRAHRATPRCQGLNLAVRMCSTSTKRHPVYRQRSQVGPRRLFRALSAPHLARRTLLVVVTSTCIASPERLRRAHAANRTRVPVRFAAAQTALAENYLGCRSKRRCQPSSQCVRGRMAWRPACL